MDGLRIKGKTAEMWATADALLRLAPDGVAFTKPGETHTSKYIPLSVQLGKGTRHKNAMAVHDDYVSFMVKDWSMDSVVIDAGFTTEQNTERGKRLHVYGISFATLEDNRDLFRKLLVEAYIESRERQKTQPRKSTS